MAAGMLGGMKHGEQDLNKALFVYCGLGATLMGFIVWVWVSMLTCRKRCGFC